MDFIPGFAPAVVVDNKDPEGTGRVRVSIPGLIEPMTPYWVMPGCWPGGGGVSKGSQYPPPEEGAQVLVIFAYGEFADPNSQAFYFTGYYGVSSTGASAGPASVASAASAEEARSRICVWEDDAFRIMVHNFGTDKKVLIQAKSGGSKIELNAADGTSGKSESIYLESKTAISVYTQGLLDLNGGVVQICGRKVSKLSTAQI